jgi:hypothetical protein
MNSDARVGLFHCSLRSCFLALGGGGTLGLDGGNDGGDLVVGQKANRHAALEHGDLDGARGLDDLEEGGDGELDRIGTLRLVVLLEVLAHGLGVAADGARLPLDVRAGRVGLVETRLAIDFVADDERGDAKGTHAAALCVLLLHAGDVARDIVDRRRVFQRQAIRLALNTRAVNQHAAVGGQAGERQMHVLVQCDDFVHGARVLKFRNRLFLNR